MADHKKDKELSEKELENVAGGKAAQNPAGKLSDVGSAKDKLSSDHLKAQRNDPGNKDRDSGLSGGAR